MCLGESMRRNKEQTTAETNITIRRLRRELEFADSRASNLTSQLESSIDKMVTYQQHMGHLQRQLRKVVEESQSKGSELAQIKTVLESLEEESGDEALEQNYEPTAALHWNCQENNTWLQERDSDVFRLKSAEPLDIISSRKHKRVAWKPVLPFGRRTLSTSSTSLSEHSMHFACDSKRSGLLMEDKAFNGISQLEGQLIDSQAEIARLALSNETALKDAESLHITVKSLEEQLSGVLHDASKPGTEAFSTKGLSSSRPYSPRASSNSDDEPSDSQRTTIYVHVGEDYEDQRLMAIATMQVAVNATWTAIDAKVLSTFELYLSKLDGKSWLGLDRYSIAYYWLGDVKRAVGTNVDESTSPHEAAVGSKAAVILHLRGTDDGSCDALAFCTLIPKQFLQAYSALILAYHKVLIVGPQSSGKTFLAGHLVRHCLVRLGVHVPDEAVFLSSMDSFPLMETGEKVRQVLKEAEQKELCAAAVILDDVRSFEQLGIVTETLSAITGQNIIVVAIMTLSDKHKAGVDPLSHHLWTWRQIQLWCHSEPIHSLLDCFLTRRLIQTNVQTSADDRDLTASIEWVCKVWHRVNHVLDCCSSLCAPRGPCQFFDCPMNTVDIQVWFTLLWNHMILPYLSMIFRMSSHESYSADCAWVSDPAGWILDGIPWQEHSNSLPILKLERSDFGLHANIPSSYEGGERFLEHMAGLLGILVRIPMLPPAPQPMRKMNGRTLSVSRIRKVSVREMSPSEVVQSVL